MLSPFARREWLIIAALGLALVIGALLLGWWIIAAVLAVATLALLGFFRDPARSVPTMRGLVISPADGRVRSIHDVEHFEPFDGPAHCVRIFMSVLDVHVQRAPMHGRVTLIEHRPGKFLNALKPESADENEALTMTLVHPTRDVPVCAVRQIAGAIARRIVCGAAEGEILQRGQRYGIIKFGSTVELYLPASQRVQLQVGQGVYVRGGLTVIASVSGDKVEGPA